ncbi:Hemin-binding periplasmic protein HmuT [Sinobacterium norvegicum]|uniref:Hemin-binding periplasmic protein HmuT n=1 Tax=Sinobacterium norvegicum TaxID=1641715 RepID=A0ABM9ABN2_9GAMM|nr:ABC transporter substrate-binding protein [Sinobacterium norvegicum]CAH0990607.1 Hemin-binding periplasmic protein HmuT [Sinobacterium norvegicum]
MKKILSSYRLPFAASIFASAVLLSNPLQADRIISTDAGSTDILLALDEGNDLVGVDVTSVVPAELSVAKLGYHRMLATEGILSLNPGLIIGSEHMGPPETIAAIEKSQIELLQLPAATNADSLKLNIKKISTAVDKQQQAQPLLAHIDKQMLSINQQQLAADTKVAFLLQMDGRSLRLAGENTTGNDIIRLLGGENLSQLPGYQSISAEALISLEPEVIIIASRDMSKPPVEALLKDNPLLVHTPAGQQQKIIAVDGRNLIAGISLTAIDSLADIADTLAQAQR